MRRIRTVGEESTAAAAVAPSCDSRGCLRETRVLGFFLSLGEWGVVCLVRCVVKVMMGIILVYLVKTDKKGKKEALTYY